MNETSNPAADDRKRDAAGELYDALKALVAARDEEPPMITAAEWAAARAALAKADGK